ncbi:MAG: sigma-70 family RNA polymerase sigma factor [Christensenellales bacterium]|jgi:RNA polymerase sigma factor (sigma-70 family)
MAKIPRQSVPYRFDSFCKKVLRNEAVNYLLQIQRQYEREVSFSDLSYSELGKLCVTDDYPSDYFTFTAHGCELRIDNAQVAEVFAELSPTEQSILILRFVMEMTDKEVGAVLGMSRCAVQRRRTKTLVKMRDKLKTLLPKGG